MDVVYFDKVMKELDTRQFYFESVPSVMLICKKPYCKYYHSQ